VIYKLALRHDACYKVFTMKNAILTIVYGILLTFSQVPLYAGSFIKIISVDAHSHYPFVSVVASVTGTDYFPITGLLEDDIQVYEDGFRVNRLQLTPFNDKAGFVYFVFSLDSSKSISRNNLLKIKNAARELVPLFRPDDKFAIFHFNNSTNLLQLFSSNKEVIFNTINTVETRGTKTVLYNTLYDSIELLNKTDSSNRVIVVFTDGIDEGSSLGPDDVIKHAKEIGIPIFVVYVKSRQEGSAVSRIAKMTGGRMIRYKSTSDITDLQKSIMAILGAKYLIRYPSMVQEDSNKHTIDLHLQHDSIRDRDSKDIYFAKPSDTVLSTGTFYKIIVVLLSAIILLIVLCLIFLIKKGTIGFSKKYMDKPGGIGIEPDFERTIALDAAKRSEREKTLIQPDAEYAYTRAWLVEKNGPETGKKYPLYWEEITIGRDAENSIIIKDSAVSLKHAKIKDIKGVYYLFDLASDNGTYLNDKKMLRPKPLYDWDEIIFGRSSFVFRGTKLS
jgi:VWFA-related protein